MVGDCEEDFLAEIKLRLVNVKIIRLKHKSKIACAIKVEENFSQSKFPPARWRLFVTADLLNANQQLDFLLEDS